jgi:RNA polymerase sigma-54 factor
MPLLQPRLNLKVSQRQILTPGLMQMVSVLALNKLELTEMINAEMIENPVLEEIDETVPTLDEIGGREAMRDRVVEEAPVTPKDPFEEIDFGSYFQDYLDPGFRTSQEYEELDKPSFEQFLSAPTTLTDHLNWQLGAVSLDAGVREAAEFLIGNLDDDGYLSTPLDELAEAYAHTPGTMAGTVPLAAEALQAALRVVQQLDPAGIAARDLRECLRIQLDAQLRELELVFERRPAAEHGSADEEDPEWPHEDGPHKDGPRENATSTHAAATARPGLHEANGHAQPAFVLDADSRNAYALENASGNGASMLHFSNGNGKVAQHPVAGPSPHPSPHPSSHPSPHHSLHAEAEAVLEQRRQTFAAARAIVDSHLTMLQKRDLKEIARAIGRPVAEVNTAVELIRTLDPRPGRRYNRDQTRLIEPDVAFVKRGDTWMVAMNEEDMPTLRLSQRYRRMLVAESTDKEVKDYVKERFRSAMQLMRNIAQRKSTILRTCEVIVRRQQEFLDVGIEALRPMMIKEVAEEIGVHPSTVSRAVANKYAHTPQGVIELRFFFSEGANGPEGADTPLVVLKRKVRKLIEEENPRHPLTDDQLAALLQGQGIQVTRRTVAKYREDMHIPSTHQRRNRQG